MKMNRFVLTLCLCSALSLPGNMTSAFSTTKNVAFCKTNGVYKPAKGSVERKAILNGFRALWLKDSSYKNVIFVVDYLAVKNGWAYLSVSPQSPNGKNHYESESALMRRQNGKWKVLQRLGSEIECDLPCLKSKFPQMPTAIYPKN